MGTSKNEYGEGNYKASREYNKATKTFVESGRVDEAAREAAPDSEAEAMEMANAEAEGRRRAKEEDPALRRGGEKRNPENEKPNPENDSQGKPVTDRSAEETRTPEPGKEGA